MRPELEYDLSGRSFSLNRDNNANHRKRIFNDY